MWSNPAIRSGVFEGGYILNKIGAASDNVGNDILGDLWTD